MLFTAGPTLANDPVNRSHPLNRGRVGWWLGLPGTPRGRYVHDVMGRNHGTHSAGASWTAAGPPGGLGSVLYDGTAGLTDCGNVAAFALTSQVTLAIWANANTWVPDYKDYLIGREGSSSPYFGYGLRTDGGGVISFKIGTTVENTVSTTPPATGTWNRIAGTYDGASMRFYINGVLVNSAALTGAIFDPNVALYIGNCPGDPTRGFDGRLADASVWNRALSAGEVAADYLDSLAGHAATLRRRRRSLATFSPPAGGGGGLAPLVGGGPTKSPLVRA